MSKRATAVMFHNWLTAMITDGFNEPVKCYQCAKPVYYPLPIFLVDSIGELRAYCGEECLARQLNAPPF